MRRVLGALVVVVAHAFAPAIGRRARAPPSRTPRAALDADIAECEAELKRADDDSAAADARCASLRETVKALSEELDEAKLEALSARAEVRKLTSSLGVLEQRRNLERAARRAAAANAPEESPDAEAPPVGDALADKAAAADKTGGAGRGLSPVAAARARKKAAAAARPPDEAGEDAEDAEDASAAPAESRVAAQIGTLAAVAGGTALALGVIEAETLLAAGAATAAAISVGVSAVRGNGTAAAVAATDDAAGDAAGAKPGGSTQEK